MMYVILTQKLMIAYVRHEIMHLKGFINYLISTHHLSTDNNTMSLKVLLNKVICFL